MTKRTDELRRGDRVNTPYPGEGMPHMDLTEIRPGTYEIGS